MQLIQAALLGIVEGITEFLPISSTAHLIIVERWLNITQTDFVKTFTISIQLGAILSIIMIYWKEIISDAEIWKKVCLAFLPTAVLGFVFYNIIKNILLGNIMVIVWALMIGGLFLIIFEIINRKNEKFKGSVNTKSITYPKAIAIGFFQALGMIPGVSRAAATIIGGLSMGINRQTIVEFSFLLAIPTMLAATVYDLFKSNFSFSGQQIEVWLTGFIVSFIVAMITVKFLIKFIQKHTFIAFGIYRIIISFIILSLLL
ncbi:MAG: undecaprenyl-diphosphatase UppP [bacterium]